MSNHPNRGAKKKAANPLPTQIINARHDAGITQTEAAILVHSSCRSWQQWEAGDRRMHPAVWELLQIKIKSFKDAAC